jgi:hypothetical protein
MRLKTRLSLIAINGLVFLVLAESAAATVYYVRHGLFFYTATKAVPSPIVETSRGELSADILHPYFGPIHRPGVRPQTNNVGFASPRAFPYPRANGRQFLVGIFGGSVAQAFCERGASRLVAALQREGDLAARARDRAALFQPRGL